MEKICVLTLAVAVSTPHKLTSSRYETRRKRHEDEAPWQEHLTAKMFTVSAARPAICVFPREGSRSREVIRTSTVVVVEKKEASSSSAAASGPSRGSTAPDRITSALQFQAFPHRPSSCSHPSSSSSSLAALARFVSPRRNPTLLSLHPSLQEHLYYLLLPSI